MPESKKKTAPTPRKKYWRENKDSAHFPETFDDIVHRDSTQTIYVNRCRDENWEQILFHWRGTLIRELFFRRLTWAPLVVFFFVIIAFYMDPLQCPNKLNGKECKPNMTIYTFDSGLTIKVRGEIVPDGKDDEKLAEYNDDGVTSSYDKHYHIYEEHPGLYLDLFVKEHTAVGKLIQGVSTLVFFFLVNIIGVGVRRFYNMYFDMCNLKNAAMKFASLTKAYCFDSNTRLALIRYVNLMIISGFTGLSPAYSKKTLFDPLCKKFNLLTDEERILINTTFETYQGVRYHPTNGGEWEAYRFVKASKRANSNKIVSLGTFKTEMEAASAYDAYAIKEGEPLNFPSGEHQKAAKSKAPLLHETYMWTLGLLKSAEKRNFLTAQEKSDIHLQAKNVRQAMSKMTVWKQQPLLFPFIHLMLAITVAFLILDAFLKGIVGASTDQIMLPLFSVLVTTIVSFGLIKLALVLNSPFRYQEHSFRVVYLCVLVCNSTMGLIGQGKRPSVILKHSDSNVDTRSEDINPHDDRVEEKASESSDHSLKLDESNPSGLPPPDSIMSESQFFQGRSTSLKRLSAVTEADEDDSEEEDKQKEN